MNAQELHDGHDAQLLVVYPGERVHTPEPEAEELVGPTIALENLQGENGVVIDGVDDHFHQVDPVRLDLYLGRTQHTHRHVDESMDALVNVTPEAQHHCLSELAGADSVDTANFTVDKHIRDHLEQGSHVLGVLHELRGAILDEVVKCGQHVLEVQLSAGLEGGMDELKSLPHDGRDLLGRKGAAVNDLENFVVKI
jgi:hypothetical protein